MWFFLALKNTAMLVLHLEQCNAQFCWYVVQLQLHIAARSLSVHMQWTFSGRDDTAISDLISGLCLYTVAFAYLPCVRAEEHNTVRDVYGNEEYLWKFSMWVGWKVSCIQLQLIMRIESNDATQLEIMRDSTHTRNGNGKNSPVT